MPASGRTIYETGSEPEFFVEEIARVEPLGGGMVRLYIGCERQGFVRVEYTVVVCRDRLAEIGRACLAIAAEMPSREIWMPVEVAH